ncbi:E3 ubiquitin-protein ligase Praja-2 isoform X2 [Pimephales promelas]|uniref:E3 ubiquitin-protein ligase Praja-2 isoform X2 n=1 Tax=Pimephales promelas TaxID=90988 RepID=UPI0019555A17|nr:E3 ubiquitin-protein ligase Praja-2 isoform X2 [Pimephales promelas]KAG1957345.1 E3 ubiquitin-protein ligase Praja-2 [Pimephales promelas]
MGQEAGKSAWPRPAGGYQTISGRRYGRRHAYISFRPLTDKQRATSGVDCQNMERTSSQKDQAVASKASISSVLQTILPTPCTNSVRSELNAASSHEGHSKRQSSLLRVLKAPSNHFKRPKTERVVPYDKQYCPGIERSDRARVWPINEDRKPNPEALSYINIDAYEPDSSGAEEEDLSLNPSLPAQKRLDGICALGGNIDSLDDSHPDIFPKTSKRSAQTVPSKNLTELPFEEPDFQRTVQANGNVGQSLVGEDQASNGHGFMAGAGGVSYMSTEETLQSEMVVRPKIRKQTSETHLERRKRSEKEDVSHLSGSADRNKCGSAPPGFLAQTSPENEFLFEFPPMTLSDLYSKDTKSVNDDNTKVDDDDDDDDNIWEDLEKFEPSTKGDESSSEFSEGEWSASWTSDSGLEKERCTSEESWETLPGMDEPPGSSNSLEEVPSLNLALEEQTPLEEGEIPWLMYNEDSGSSSDEDPDGVSQFVHPGLFILDGNNNLEDDSSMSEDLDTEWRFLDEFGDGFGMAQAISYVDHSQLLTYMALEERLAQAMEAALAHLESLAIDVEQAHPPATEQIIDCLPQITVPAENIEQEQCCAICCCEYVKDEIATLLPCRHMFHKLCVTLWLRKSGTCPVCRHVLTPEVTDPSSLSSEQETPPSSHSASEGTC